ncbi:formate dehydrogenase subunit gamma [Aquibium microcysteis]|uniref:formate dehydrogenase subunit gamma n=1 Tax=Aquibium microcysteis TaxID=675281 RepID=UPI00165D17EB|nr:formate dehydrogenase subunit gamma [Aquibium microcysteis]
MRNDAGRTEERLIDIVNGWSAREAPLLPILNEVQASFGYMPENAAEVIGRALNLSRAEVHGVISFYHDFRKEPAGRHVLKVCRAEACQAVGGREMADHLKRLLGLDWHETAADGSVTLEPVYCLGLCACAPAAMLDGELIGRIDAELVEDIAREVRT